MSAADEAGAVVSAVYWTNKAGVAVAKGAHRKAQNMGMRYQNWRHKGAGETDTPALGGAEDPAPYPGRFAKKSARKNWTTDEETFEQDIHTTYTRSRTR